MIHPTAPKFQYHNMGFSIFPAIAFLFLIFNSGTAIYRARRDPSTVSFLVGADLNLILLLWCLNAIKSSSSSSKSTAAKELLLKIFIWVLATSLNFSFSYRMSRNLPFSMTLAMGSVAVVTSLAIFYAFFVHDGGGTYRYRGGEHGTNNDRDGGGGSSSLTAKLACHE